MDTLPYRLDLSTLLYRLNPAISHWEALQLLTYLVNEVPRDSAVLEIGTYQGASARVWRDALLPRLLVTVSRYDEFEGSDADITRVIGTSQDRDTIETVRSALAGNPVDFLFVDGGHSLPEVSADWDNYTPLVRPGGVVALHDVHASLTDVPLFWSRLQEQYATVTFRASGQTGIGMVRL